jgi:hypothetical protein
MKRFVEGEDRRQGVLLPEFLDDYVAEDNPLRAIDVFVGELDLRGLGFEGVVAETTGRPTSIPILPRFRAAPASALEHRLFARPRRIARLRGSAPEGPVRESRHSLPSAK